MQDSGAPNSEQCYGVELWVIVLNLMAFYFFQGQSPSIRQLIMHSMAEWYMRGEQYDQAKLSRILDVAQDLKVCQTHQKH